MLAYECLADELYYGGAAGGGKTDLLLGLAFTAHRRSIIFRTEYTQMRGMIERSREIAGTRARFNGQTKTWRVGGNRIIEFGACKLDTDVERFQGQPHDFIGFDELPAFSRDHVITLAAWCRTNRPGQRTRWVGAGNPPTTPEGEWVIKEWEPWLDPRFPHPAKPGALRWYIRTSDDTFEWVDGPEYPTGVEDRPAPVAYTDKKGVVEYIEPRSRTFIPAKVDDNPYYMATGYKGQLQALPEPLRSKLLMGDFKPTLATAKMQVIPTEWIVEAQNRWSAERPRMANGEPIPLQQMGVDVARGGKDEFVIAKRFGYWVDELEVHPGSDTPDGPAGAGLIMESRDAEAGPDGKPSRAWVFIDVIGVGSAVWDSLPEHWPNLYPFDSREGSNETDLSGLLTFANQRAFAWWNMREMLDPRNGYDVALPPDRILRADLAAPRWKPTPRGIVIESKEDIEKRLKRSTNRADAVIYAFVQNAVPDSLYESLG